MPFASALPVRVAAVLACQLRLRTLRSERSESKLQFSALRLRRGPGGSSSSALVAMGRGLSVRARLVASVLWYTKLSLFARRLRRASLPRLGVRPLPGTRTKIDCHARLTRHLLVASYDPTLTDRPAARAAHSTTRETHVGVVVSLDVRARARRARARAREPRVVVASRVHVRSLSSRDDDVVILVILLILVLSLSPVVPLFVGRVRC